MKLPPSSLERVTAREFLYLVLLIHAVTFFVTPWFFTWGRFAFAFGLAMLFGHSMGIFHHMLLTHRSFKIVKPLEYLGALLGTLTWRGPMAAPIRYVAMHRVHHMHSDQEQDPHSPIHGYFHALLGWFWWLPQAFLSPAEYDPIAGTLAQDPVMRFFDRHVNLLQALFGTLVFVVAGLAPSAFQGTLGFDWQNAFIYAIYGVFVKSFILIYLANLVDVVNHSVGYRNYETDDLSTNSALMGMVHLGGAVSWHNNHHAHPAYFRVKRQWWEIDVHFLSLKALEKIGLASDIKELVEGAELLPHSEEAV